MLSQRTGFFRLILGIFQSIYVRRELFLVIASSICVQAIVAGFVQAAFNLLNTILAFILSPASSVRCTFGADTEHRQHPRHRHLLRRLYRMGLLPVRLPSLFMPSR